VEKSVCITCICIVTTFVYVYFYGIAFRVPYVLVIYLINKVYVS
jgi:hypothetical protein